MVYVYVVTCFKNSGWGTRIDNYDVFTGMDVFSDAKLAEEYAKDYAGSNRETYKKYIVYGGTTITAKIHKIKVKGEE